MNYFRIRKIVIESSYDVASGRVLVTITRKGIARLDETTQSTYKSGPQALAALADLFDKEIEKANRGKISSKQTREEKVEAYDAATEDRLLANGMDADGRRSKHPPQTQRIPEGLGEAAASSDLCDRG